MKYSLFFLSMAAPIALLIFGVKVINTPFFAALAFVLALAEVIYAYRQFHSIGRDYDFDLADAFWLSACVDALITLVFLAIQVWYSWRCVAGFAEIEYAYVPLAAGFMYCCLLGAIICGIRLKMNSWIGKTSKAQTCFFLITALSLMACTFYAIGNMYLGLGLPEDFLNANYGILWLCVLGIIICGYRLTILKKD
ncbi:MAG: hypothetical protein IKN71_06475 [Alphaproteobacteria bacterium]|nr:hypothetical protein [Alphaproteobacteria bacterium]